MVGGQHGCALGAGGRKGLSEAPRAGEIRRDRAAGCRGGEVAGLRRGRASSSYIATFEPAATFGDLVKAEGIRRGAGQARQFTIIGDGAAWILGIATSKFPEATQIVDLYHAREHLHSLARSLEFMLLDRKEEWLAAPGRLRLRVHRRHPRRRAPVPLEGLKKDEAEKELGYFLNNASRMRYHWFRQCGLFVGSGIVGAGCKAVIGQRLKQSGMHWTVAGADAIIALRCADASSQREATCTNRHNQTPCAQQPACQDDLGYLQICRAPEVKRSRWNVSGAG